METADDVKIPLTGYQRTILISPVCDSNNNVVSTAARHQYHGAVLDFPDEAAENLRSEYVHFAVPVKGEL